MRTILLTALLSVLRGQAPAFLQDGDGDGWRAFLDCDDADAATHPEQIETFYDGIDNACDGSDRCDADRDGLPWEGAAVLPMCEAWYIGVDLDCDDSVSGSGCGW